MPNHTNEKSKIYENLNYIGLDLENIPSFLLEYQDVEFRPNKTHDENQFKVYRRVPLRNIQILLTPTNRLNTAFEKYTKAEPIVKYLDRENEENLIKHATLLKLFEKLNKKEIEQIEKEQIKLKKEIPFKVKYTTNYLWDIYYSEYTGKYFMMVTLEDMDSSAFFYLLKKQIELAKKEKDDYLFVPINEIDYTKRYLKKSEITDIEKYIWLFTKQWPNIYEVFDENNELTMHVVGKTTVYDEIITDYKNELRTKEEASKFYQLLKALFILQTELPNYYHFETQIGEKGELIFEYNSKVISFDNLSKFIKDEYQTYASDLKEIFTYKEEQEKTLEKLQEEEKDKNLEYLFREKQVATYLECRTTVFGRIKYFFRGKSGRFVKTKEKEKKKKNSKEKNEMERNISYSVIEEKKYYTIEDLIKICIELERIQIRVKNTESDIKALNDKIQSMNNKIKNATLYLKKIEEHKKSIFEFWKFANRDEAVGLNAGKEEEKEKESKPNLKRTFHFEEDFEEIGIEADRIQRDILTRKECDALFLTTTNVLEDINKVRDHRAIQEKKIVQLKEEAEKEIILFETENFDIFGNVKEDKTKINILANQKHREVEKSKLKLLDITKNTEVEDYKETLEQWNKSIDEALTKTKAIIDMNLYMAGNEKLNGDHIGVFHINPMKAIEEQVKKEKISIYKIQVAEGMSLAYASNIIYYDNDHQTLPKGMNVSDKVIVDMSQYDLKVKKQKIFRINQEINEEENKTKIVCVYEYELKNL